MELGVSWVKVTSAKNRFYTFAYTVLINWQMFFIFSRKSTCIVFFLLIEVGVSWSRSLVLNIDFYTFAYIEFISPLLVYSSTFLILVFGFFAINSLFLKVFISNLKKGGEFWFTLRPSVRPSVRRPQNWIPQ
jgi:hypothetical protein